MSMESLQKHPLRPQLKGRHLLTLKEFTAEEILYLLDLSAALKHKKKTGKERGDLLANKNICLVFEKDSTRTRCAFEVAAYDEGCMTTYLQGSHTGKKESIEDTAKVLGRYYDGIEFRGALQSVCETLAQHSGVPVWNGLTDAFHPTQILADLLTIQEHLLYGNKKGTAGLPNPATNASAPPPPPPQLPADRFKGVKLVFVGDTRNNVAISLMIAAAKLGMHYVALAPESLWPKGDVLTHMQEAAKATGGTISCSADVASAVKGAKIIYTDVWVSMGEEALWEERIQQLRAYQVNMDMIKATDEADVIFMHCLPSFHDLQTVVGRQVGTQVHT